jgi:hypothetical protein
MTISLSAITAALSVVCPLDGMGGPYTAQQVSDGNIASTFPAADGSLWRLDFDPSATGPQQTAAQQILLTFNPAGPIATGETQFQAALAGGITITWSVSTALNDTYPIDTATQVRMLAERVSVAVNATFTNGTTSLTWFGITGTSHTMTVAQAGIFVKVIWTYITALFVARATAAAGGVPSWPTAAVAVIG